ncbi:MAG TPA: RHS repeat-associated core domain-containing protein [Methylotenera sp.]
MPLAEVEFKYNTSTGAVTSTSQYYLHSDHLNTPRLATNQAQTLLWSWDSDAFGLGNPNGDPDGDGVVVDIPLRFPGQIFEAYSNLNYNYFRDYDPNTGRYVQSDPIGLEGGLNTYGYVGGNPLIASDPLGLAAITLQFPRWLIALPGLGVLGGLGVPGVVGLACLAYPNNSLAGPEMDDCAGGCVYAKPPENAYDPNGPKAPGKPSAEDGFQDPKTGESWVPNPNPGKGGGSHGWLDSKGRVWVPTGQGGRSHGGAHWDVQTPGGGYINVRPTAK